MEENWYVLRQHAHDRIAEAREIARSQALMRELAPPNRARYAIGLALIRLGSWVLTSGMRLPTEVAHTLTALRTATDRSLRT